MLLLTDVSAPTGFEASDQTTSEITLMWNEPANTLFSSYILSYSKKTTMLVYKFDVNKCRLKHCF